MYYETLLAMDSKFGKDDYYLKAKIETGNWKAIKEYVSHEKKLESSVYNNVQERSGVYEPHDLKAFINSFMPGSFGLWYQFELKAPYFSADDDPLYLLSNPILKEQTSKLPMIPGSSWKGLLSAAACRKLKDTVQKEEDIKGVLRQYRSYIRIFGTGSEDFRSLQSQVKKIIEKKEKIDANQLIKELLKYCVIDLGIRLKLKNDGSGLARQLADRILEERYKDETDKILTVRQGRATFYPTYFLKLDYKIINPQDRKKRVGTNPIYYEVVPAKCKGIFQLIYIPHDGLSISRREFIAEIEQDREFLKRLLKRGLEEIGIGAKAKLGWGRAEVKLDEIKCFENWVGETKDG